MSRNELYFIWSHEHGGWWRKGERGYTPNHHEAGLYTRDRAIAICRGAKLGVRDGEPPNEVPVSVDDAAAIWGVD